MVDIPEKILKKVVRSFPTMNVIIGEDGKEYKGALLKRGYDGYEVTIVAGLSNAMIIDAQKKAE